MSNGHLTTYNREQRVARLNREIAHFRAQIERFGDAATPREKAAYTRAKHCLNRRLADLAKWS